MSKTRSAPVANARTLAELVEDFRLRLGPEGPLEAGYMEWMRAAPNLKTAIDRAVRSRKPDGKMHNHQSRIPLYVLLRYGRELFEHLEKRRPRTFHFLLLKCEAAAVPGIGPVTQYDVAQRLGQYLGLEPERVYLHAGVKQGAAALDVLVGVDKRRTWLMPEEFPVELQGLTPNELEDFLCVYRDIFPKLRRRSGRH